MYPLLRLARVLATTRSRGPIDALGESVLAFRVGIGDMDTSLHLNNGRYLTLMDLGRFDLMGRAGMLRELFRRRWIPVVASSTIRHVRPLDAFARFELRTRIVGWDEQGFFLEQRFVQDGKVAAIGAIKGVFREGRRTVAPHEILTIAGHADMPAPPLPEWLTMWQQGMDALRRAEVEPSSPGAAAVAPSPPG
jgi:acyl-CoA thioesterase FadM